MLSSPFMTKYAVKLGDSFPPQMTVELEADNFTYLVEGGDREIHWWQFDLNDEPVATFRADQVLYFRKIIDLQSVGDDASVGGESSEKRLPWRDSSGAID